MELTKGGRSRKSPLRRSNRAAVRSDSKGHQIGTTAEVNIDRFAHDGRGIGLLNGKVVFVENALPTETHLIKISAVKSKFAEAISEQLLSEPSEHRVAPQCQYFERCGGCQLQHLDVSAQLNFKSNLVIDQLRRVGIDLKAEIISPITSANSFGYRSRARLSLNHRGMPYAGFRARANNQIIKVEHCAVLTPKLSASLPYIQSALAHFRPEVLGHIDLIDTDERPIIICRHLATLTADELGHFVQLAEQASVNIYLQPESEPVYYTLDGTQTDVFFNVSVPSMSSSICYQASNFSQVNTSVNHLMVDQFLAWSAPQTHETWLDLFCGVGNFSLPLAKQVARVIGVEVIQNMVDQATENAVDLAVPNCEFITADLESTTSLRRLPKSIDGIILDPPRAGAKEVMENIGRLSPKKVVYVSCDPATFARDAKILIEKGYRIERVGALDMFPQTMHVETMALFCR